MITPSHATDYPPVVRIGSRTSALAMWQTHHVIALLTSAWPDLHCEIVPFVTKGDKTLDQSLPSIGGKGLFTAELEAELRRGGIDLAVHSLKDLPVENAPGTRLGAICARADVRDTLVARNGWTLATLPNNAVVGTSSPRRQAQLLARRPDLTVRSIRGNVETRMRKVQEGDYHATLLAAAGLQRLGLDHAVTEWLTVEEMLPAPGQAALAIQCRADDTATRTLLAAIHDVAAAAAVTAEREFLAGLGGGCSAPIAAFARHEEEKLRMDALVGATDGRRMIRVHGVLDTPTDGAPVGVETTGDASVVLARRLVEEALAAGAADLLAAET